MTVAEFRLDPAQGKLTSSLKIPRGSVLYSRPVEGVPCKFRTCYDVTLWPVEIAEAKWLTPDKLNPPLRAPEAAAALRVELRCLSDLTFDKLNLTSLRFYLHGEGDIVHTLYELLSNNCTQIVLRDPANTRKPPVTLAREFLAPHGLLPKMSPCCRTLAGRLWVTGFFRSIFRCRRNSSSLSSAGWRRWRAQPRAAALK